jgi:outer membrane protein assembly factor BamB
MRFHQKWLTVAAAAVLLPPAGLVLLWMRPGTSVLKKVLGSLLVVPLALAHLVLIYGLRVEFSGGMKPTLSFESPERRDRAVEQSRSAPPPAPPAAAPAAEEKPPAASGSTYWTDFRGPGRLGHYDQQPIRTDWPAQGLPRLWKQPSGGGYAGFTVANGVAFTIEQRRNREVVAAYDLLTGRERWTNSWPALFHETLGGDGPRATPVWDGGRLYALGAEGEFRCLDAATGKTV